MGDFFAGLGGGMRFPDTQMNVGPLPSLGGGAPAGAHGDPDGRINFNSSLLDGITPYAGPDKGRIGSDRNYQQIPHRIQKIIHLLHVPHATNKQKKIPVSHVVDQGDVAFVLNTEDNSAQLFNHINVGAVDRERLCVQSVFINLATANYILAGIQRAEKDDAGSAGNRPSLWHCLKESLGDFDDTENKKDDCGKFGRVNNTGEHDAMLKNKAKAGRCFANIERIVRTRIIPFGICAGSEKQGGQSETGFAPVQAAVNHVTTMTVDGQNIDLINYWADLNLSAGDQLIFKLEWKPTQEYVLNHYYKDTVSASFQDTHFCWQLVPSVHRMGDPIHPLGEDFDYRVNGYWRIAQLMQHRKSCSSITPHYWNNDMTNMRPGGSAQLLQVLFAPVYYNMKVSTPIAASSSATTPPTTPSAGSVSGTGSSVLGTYVEGASTKRVLEFTLLDGLTDTTSQPRMINSFAGTAAKPFMKSLRASLRRDIAEYEEDKFKQAKKVYYTWSNLDTVSTNSGESNPHSWREAVMRKIHQLNLVTDQQTYMEIDEVYYKDDDSTNNTIRLDVKIVDSATFPITTPVISSARFTDNFSIGSSSAPVAVALAPAPAEEPVAAPTAAPVAAAAMPTAAPAKRSKVTLGRQQAPNAE